MSVRAIIRIDEEKCTGCGLCVPDCAEGALKIIDGKARLIGEGYCDGLGACLGACPEGALTIEEREAVPFSEQAVEELLAETAKGEPLPCGCTGSTLRTFEPSSAAQTERGASLDPSDRRPTSSDFGPLSASALRQWPVQLRLVPPHAPFLRNADILLCADCVPFAEPDLHAKYMSGRVVLVGCPKFDDLDDYRQRLVEIFYTAKPRTVTVLRMEVPCCGGLATIAREAHAESGSDADLQVEIIPIVRAS